MKKVKLTWVKSSIGAKEPHKRTIKALGFHRLNETIVKQLTPEVQGMINSVSYLVKVEDAE